MTAPFAVKREKHEWGPHFLLFLFILSRGFLGRSSFGWCQQNPAAAVSEYHRKKERGKSYFPRRSVRSSSQSSGSSSAIILWNILACFSRLRDISDSSSSSFFACDLPTKARRGFPSKSGERITAVGKISGEKKEKRIYTIYNPVLHRISPFVP